MRIVTLPNRQPTLSSFSWRAHYSLLYCLFGTGNEYINGRQWNKFSCHESFMKPLSREPQLFSTSKWAVCLLYGLLRAFHAGLLHQIGLRPLLSIYINNSFLVSLWMCCWINYNEISVYNVMNKNGRGWTTLSHETFSVFRHVCKASKSDCPSARTEQICSRWKNFREILYLEVFLNSVDKINFF